MSKPIKQQVPRLWVLEVSSSNPTWRTVFLYTQGFNVRHARTRLHNALNPNQNKPKDDEKLKPENCFVEDMTDATLEVIRQAESFLVRCKKDEPEQTRFSTLNEAVKNGYLKIVRGSVIVV